MSLSDRGFDQVGFTEDSSKRTNAMQSNPAERIGTTKPVSKWANQNSLLNFKIYLAGK